MRYFVAASLLLLVSGCDGLFPTQSKPYVPADHTVSFSGSLHPPGYTDPLDPSHGCTDCHGSKLTGGVHIVGGNPVAAPSCYQCHGAVWERGVEDREREDD
jgi:hypothetical protein